MSFFVDIILPNYNKEFFLQETINSVLNQSYKNWKLVIVDNCSTDNSKTIIEKFRKNKKIDIIHLKKNMGVSFSRNLGIRLSNSKYISFLDADDLWTPNKLNDQINFMEEKDYKFTYTDYTPFFEKNKKKILKKKVTTPDIFDFEAFINNSSISTSSMIISRDAVKTIKFPKVATLEDFPFKCKILNKIQFAKKFNQNTLFYRITKNSLTSNKLKNLLWLWKINKIYNKLTFFKNLKSLFFISINSLKKYGYK
jgi:teichuronic acid biosynthesis glycosyltransferase TuaG|tara:strand:+ start:1298 stop:2056 length:759 start_codon:yes stop_codon:yes gene_type:complete